MQRPCVLHWPVFSNLGRSSKWGEVDPKEFFERIKTSLAEATSEREWAPLFGNQSDGADSAASAPRLRRVRRLSHAIGRSN